MNFTLSGNDVSSVSHQISVIKVPTILNFEMQLNYPKYTSKKNEVVTNTGNITVPEGTAISWNLNTKTTDKVLFSVKDTSYIFTKEAANFKYKQQVFTTTNYEISTSNAVISNYEKLGYKIQVVKDGYPEINIQSKVDSTNSQIIYFLGKVSDDYGLSKLQLSV